MNISFISISRIVITLALFFGSLSNSFDYFCAIGTATSDAFDGAIALPVAAPKWPIDPAHAVAEGNTKFETPNSTHREEKSQLERKKNNSNELAFNPIV